MNLQPLITTVQQLPLTEQLELIGKVSQMLQIRYGKTNIRQDSSHTEIPDEFIKNAYSVVNDIRELKADFWPEDESADDIIDFIYEQRKKDRLQ